MEKPLYIVAYTVDAQWLRGRKHLEHKDNVRQLNRLITATLGGRGHFAGGMLNVQNYVAVCALDCDWYECRLDLFADAGGIHKYLDDVFRGALSFRGDLRESSLVKDEEVLRVAHIYRLCEVQRQKAIHALAGEEKKLIQEA